MATIYFLDGTTKEVDGTMGFKMHQVLKGIRPATPEQEQYLEQVERIDFKAKRYEELEPRYSYGDVRLPYADD